MTGQTPASSEYTPEQLTAMLREGMRREHSDEHREVVMAEVIAAAERGGDAHMLAVIREIFPDGPGQPTEQIDPMSPRYEMRDGRYGPAWHDSNVLIELQVYIDGLLFTARESHDPIMFEAYGFDTAGSNRFEEYIRYFITSNFGRVAVSTGGAYQYFRKRVWIVRPSDVHDFKRCRASHDDRTGKLWPRCLGGTILREWPQPSPIPGAGVSIRREAVLGACTCRCHRAEREAGRLTQMLRLQPFDEEQLDEKGRPR